MEQQQNGQRKKGSQQNGLRQSGSAIKSCTRNRWQLDSNTENVPSLSLGQSTLTNKCIPKSM